MLVLSTKDRDRLKILHEVKRKHLTQRAAAQQLGISDRWVRKLLVRVRKGGDGGIVHRGRAAAGEAAESGRGARVATAAELSRRAGAVGHFGARLAGRAGAEAVPGGDDR